SVAEQEGQQTETEATGAPQKHHYTLNQQVGSITNLSYCNPVVFKVFFLVTSLKYPPENAPTEARKTMQSKQIKPIL
ncbi:hypothetical protein, partial [Klebsiella pneumoniae]|uniref:hypothetical protein n=1 Tax=Klebsiella pneumoniae TaxID=573 RepID=UPI001CB738AC